MPHIFRTWDILLPDIFRILFYMYVHFHLTLYVRKNKMYVCLWTQKGGVFIFTFPGRTKKFSMWGRGWQVGRL